MTDSAEQPDLQNLGAEVFAAVVERLRPHGISLTALCKRVKMPRSTLTRWQRGAVPSLSTYLVVMRELDQMDLDRKALDDD